MDGIEGVTSIDVRTAGGVVFEPQPAHASEASAMATAAIACTRFCGVNVFGRAKVKGVHPRGHVRRTHEGSKPQLLVCCITRRN